jgi:hypothetical protein
MIRLRPWRRSVDAGDGSAEVDSFHVQIGGKVAGPFNTQELRKLPGFMLQTRVRRVGSDDWVPAFKVINLKKYLNPPMPPRPKPTLGKRLRESRREGYLRKLIRFGLAIVRWLRRILIVAILAAIAWFGVSLNHNQLKELIRTEIRKAEIYVKLQAHRSIQRLIQELHQVDLSF